jgi:plasmid stability protein
MAKSIQIRNVPDRLHRKLKKRAAKVGISLSAYLILEFRRSAEVPTPAELRRRLRRLPPPLNRQAD